MILLRDYQHEAKRQIYEAWSLGYKNVLYTLPTGSGKTVLFANIISEHIGYSCAIAHRSELVEQISTTLASFGVRHRVIASDATIKYITQQHYKNFGQCFIDQNAPAAVASIDTLGRRADALKSWMDQVTLWVQDEAHHVVKANKWGKVDTLFPNAKGLGVTATPLRADGKGLGRHHDGLFDILIDGPGMRWMIDQGYLTPYRIFVPPSDIQETIKEQKVGASGDYSSQALKKAAKKSHIVGDVVEHYLRIAPGKMGITFATDVETSQEICNQYLDAGVAVASVSAKTPDHIRSELISRFKGGNLKQITNVDLFGEGFDLPALEVVSMARPTMSYGLFVQQFGRGLRPVYAAGYDLTTQAGRLAAIAAGPKPFGIIIDHVGNVLRHGLPDAPRIWTLDRRQKRASSRDPNAIPVRACTNKGCYSAYLATLRACPYCGHKPEPQSRSQPEHVDGILAELDAATLARMRGEIAEIDKPATQIEAELKAKGLNGIYAAGHANRHRDLQAAQRSLRELMALWGGVRLAEGIQTDEAQQRFYFKFGIDVGTAMTLKRADAEKLTARIREDLGL